MRTQAKSPWRRSRLLASACAALFATVITAAQPRPARVAWNNVLDQPAGWYATAAARTVADIVLQYQRSGGGWPKDIDMTLPPAAGTAAPSMPDSTIDNGATVTQIRLLDRVFGATAHAPYRDAAIRGIDYLFAARYPGGGWPQFYPLRNDYSRHVTFNDEAMSGVLALLEDLSMARALPFADEARRRQAREAIESATELILRAQVRVSGHLTAWCAQHDAVTLEPRPARAYEHVSLSGRETVDIVRFLMRRAPRPDIVTAVDRAVDWLRQVPIRGVRVDRRTDPSLPHGHDVRLVPDASAPPLWARFYQIGTNRPMYSGRDGVVRYDISEIDVERRTGYAWLGNWPARLLDTEYPRWKARISESPAR